MIKTAVVILNWNGRTLLETFLPSVTKFSNGDHTKVFVADNGSTDDSIEFLKTNCPEVEIIDLKVNYGFAKGYNQALSQIKAEYYVLLNSDVEVTEGWLEPLVKHMDKDREVAACGPKILDYKDRTKFEYAGAAGGFMDKYGYPFCRGRIFSALETDKDQYNTVRECLWVSGCCLVVRASEYHKLNGLDNQFFAHMEEVDFCWRLTNSGLKVVNIPQSVIYHVGGASLSAVNPKKTFLNFRNSLLCLYKNTPKGKWLVRYLVRLFLDCIAAITFLFKDGISHFLAVLKAHIQFIRLAGTYRNVRKQLISERVVVNNLHVLPVSIVGAHYLNKVTAYSDIEKYFKTK